MQGDGDKMINKNRLAWFLLGLACYSGESAIKSYSHKKLQVAFIAIKDLFQKKIKHVNCTQFSWGETFKEGFPLEVVSLWEFEEWIHIRRLDGGDEEREFHAMGICANVLWWEGGWYVEETEIKPMRLK